MNNKVALVTAKELWTEFEQNETRIKRRNALRIKS